MKHYLMFMFLIRMHDVLRRMYDLKSLKHDVKMDMFDNAEVFTST